METVRVSRYRAGKRALAKAVTTLREGGVVAYPTETAYGLAADPRDRKAMRRIHRMKGRSEGKPLPLICGNVGMVRRLVSLPPALARLAGRVWPGPLTVVAPLVRRERGKVVGAKDGTVAVRVPALGLPRALSEAFGGPIVSTSANRSGSSSSYSGSAVRAAFRSAPDAPDLVLDARRLPRRPPSTIVTVKHGKIQVLRQGSIKVGKWESLKVGKCQSRKVGK